MDYQKRVSTPGTKKTKHVSNTQQVGTTLGTAQKRGRCSIGRRIATGPIVYGPRHDHPRQNRGTKEGGVGGQEPLPGPNASGQTSHQYPVQERLGTPRVQMERVMGKEKTRWWKHGQGTSRTKAKGGEYRVRFRDQMRNSQAQCTVFTFLLKDVPA